MSVLIGLMLLALWSVMSVWVWRRWSESDDRREQASLLPFADDPEAAAKLTAETGLRCEQVVQPLPEAPPAYRWDA